MFIMANITITTHKTTVMFIIIFAKSHCFSSSSSLLLTLNKSTTCGSHGLEDESSCYDGTITRQMLLCLSCAKRQTKHPKNWETALWGKEGLYWKKGFIERKALLKERLYWKKSFIERKASLKGRLYWKKGFIERNTLLKYIVKFKLWIWSNC